MYDLKRLLVALDLTRMDDDLIGFVLTLPSILEVEKIFFAHVLSENIDPNSTIHIADGTELTIAEKLERQVTDQVNRLKNAHAVPFEVIVERGSPVTELLALSRKCEADLIVVGRKSVEKGNGAISRKICRRALCSVLYVPEKAKPRFDRAVIPLDFSDFSRVALQQADRIRQRNPQFEIVGLHVFSLPNGYLSSGKSEDDFAELMRTNASRRLQHFLHEHELSHVTLEPRFQLDTVNATAKVIFNIALVEGADLIIIGSRGRTQVAAAFLGSTTERLLLHNISLPTLVIKSKRQNLGLLDALLHI
jgi:nucleotide-binding universal stress UspA family protein